MRIDQRMNAPLNTPESAELEQLVTAVGAYEAIHYPIDSPAETQALKKLIEASEHSAKDGLLSLDDAFDDDTPGEKSPFENPILTPARVPSGQGYWLSHAGLGVEDAVPMRAEHRAEFQHRIAAGLLIVSEERYVRAVQQRLVLYKRSPHRTE